MQRFAVDLVVLAGLAGALGVVYFLDGRIAPSQRETNRQGTVRNLLRSDSIYELRTRKNREEWVVEYGGSERSEEAVKSGLRWLARHQAKDGSWSNRHLGQTSSSTCESERPCTGPGSDYPFAQTGLAVLAFQAGGHFNFNGNTYSGAVQSGLHWLVKHQREDGGLYGDSGTHYMYEHGIAAFALTEACAVAVAADREPQKAYRTAAEKAICFIESQQHNDGGWRYTSVRFLPSDTSVSGWQVLAIKSAKEAGFLIDQKCVEGAVRFFESCEVEGGKTGYTGGHSLSDATTGVGMLVHQFLLETPQSDLVEQAAPYLAQSAEQKWGSRSNETADYYLWYNCTLAMKQHGGRDWDRWNDIVREELIRLQLSEESQCTRGSWSPNSKWGTTGGRIYTTALAVLTLEVYYRFSMKRTNTAEND